MTPVQAPRPCSGGCGRLVQKGRCPACSRLRDRARPSSTARGYGWLWETARVRFFGRLALAGIVPACGSVLPEGPRTEDSLCRRAGILTFASQDGTALHLDHAPPLTDAERLDPSVVCDPTRLQALCRECHTAKTDREHRRGWGGRQSV